MEQNSASPSMAIFDWESGSSSSSTSMDNLEAGFRFCNENELVLHYLGNKILGRPLPPIPIQEIPNIYKLDPLEIPIDELRYSKGNASSYCFSYIENKLAKRTTKRGYWKKKCTKEKKIYHGDVVVGFRKSFWFYWSTRPNRGRTTWTIQAYRLNPSILPAHALNESIRTKVETLVACKIERMLPSST